MARRLPCIESCLPVEKGVCGTDGSYLRRRWCVVNERQSKVLLLVWHICLARKR